MVKIAFLYDFTSKNNLSIKEKEDFYDAGFSINKVLRYYVLVLIFSVFAYMIAAQIPTYQKTATFLIFLLIFPFVIIYMIANYYQLSSSAILGISMKKIIDYRKRMNVNYLSQTKSKEISRYIRRINLNSDLSDLTSKEIFNEERFILNQFSNNFRLFYRYILLSDRKTFLKFSPKFMKLSLALIKPSIPQFIKEYYTLNKLYSKSKDYLSLSLKDYKPAWLPKVEWVERHWKVIAIVASVIIAYLTKQYVPI